MLRLAQTSFVLTCTKTAAANFSSGQHNRLVRMMHSLIKNQAYVNGEWVDGVDKKRFQVTNPANAEVIGEVPDMTAEDAKVAIDRAYETFHSKAWQNTTAKERSGLLKVKSIFHMKKKSELKNINNLQKWFELLEKNKQEIAEIMTAESGKPITESLGEVAYGNSFIEWFAEEARRINGEIVPSPVASKQMMMTKHPIGVAGLITPWNFPHAMITRKAAAAIAAGNNEMMNI